MRTKEEHDARRKEMFLRTCTHFNGIQHETCLAGQCYESLRSPIHVLPCAPVFADNARGRSVATCQKFQQQTQRDLEERDAEFERAIQRMQLVQPAVRAWRIKPKPAHDRAVHMDCPTGCGGVLHLSQSSYNGHVHGHCSTAGCVSWME